MASKKTNRRKAGSIGRRDLLKSAAVAGTGLVILRSGVLSGANAPSNKLNIAMIGTWGRASAHFGAVKNENVAALCDIDDNHLDYGAKHFPGAKKYNDWREALEQPGLDAVVCCTTDHVHPFVSIWAMNRGLHVYSEKPLANSVEEARMVRETYLKNKGKLATQVGTQRHQLQNFNRVRELVKDGAIGELTNVYAWGNRKIPKPGYLPAEGTPPKTLHYDLWLGPSPEHPYNPGYFKGGQGANCLCWNMYWDFGSGQVGDMGSHTMDLAWNAIDAGIPTSAEGKGDPFNPDVTPVKLEMKFEHPANDWRGPITVSWYQGGAMPKSPRRSVDLDRIGHGVMFKGTKGHIVADFSSRMLLPWGNSADLTYYKPRTGKTLIPAMGGFQQEWINACKTDKKTSCDFEYAGNMIEQMMLGLVAYRVGEKISYDGKAGKVAGNDKANALLCNKYRDGWKLNG